MPVAAVGHVDRRPARGCAVAARVVVAELVHSLEVEPQRTVLTVDLEPVGVVVAGGEPGRLERREPTAAEPAEEHHGIVDRAPTGPAAARGARPGDRATRCPRGSSRSVMKVCSIAPSTDTISSPVTKRTASMMWALRSPCAPDPAMSAWKRQTSGVLGSAPALQVARARRGRSGRAPPTVRIDVPARRPARGGSCTRRTSCRAPSRRRPPSASASASVPARGFSQTTCLPASSAAIDCSAWTSLGVAMSTSPTSGAVTAAFQSTVARLPTPAGRECVEVGRVATDDRVHYRQRVDLEELRHVQPRVRMGSSHELGADQCDIDGACHRSSIVMARHASTPK